MTDQPASIAITRTFDAPNDVVFAAWTTPSQFAAWFGTAANTVDDVVMDVREGGGWKARMVTGDGMVIGWHGSYVEVDPPHRLVFTLSDRPGDEFELVTVVLRAVDGGTEMTFTQAGGHMPPENYAQAEAGWRAFFDEMELGLES
jgi:uncharacterized protein YndB with AHSA1/START domain